MNAFQGKTHSGTPHHSALAVFRGKAAGKGKGRRALQKGSFATSPVLHDVPWKSLSMQTEKYAPSEPVHYTAQILLESNFWAALWQLHLLLNEVGKKMR